jgi:hypothetical protein
MILMLHPFLFLLLLLLLSMSCNASPVSMPPLVLELVDDFPVLLPFDVDDDDEDTVDEDDEYDNTPRLLMRKMKSMVKRSKMKTKMTLWMLMMKMRMTYQWMS